MTRVAPALTPCGKKTVTLGLGLTKTNSWKILLVRTSRNIASVCHFVPLAIVMELKFNKTGLGCP